MVRKVIKMIFKSERDLDHYKMMQRIRPTHVQTRIDATGKETYVATQHIGRGRKK